MRKALIVGIDYYEHIGCLDGCVNDAHRVRAILERHADNTVNFVQPRVLTGTGAANKVERATLREAIRELFADDADIALFYFAGHGYIEDSIGFLCATDTKTGDDGISLYDVMTFASKSPSTNKIVILDSCHGGVAGDRATAKGMAEIATGMTVLTASTAQQYAAEKDQNGLAGGLFTDLLIDALDGEAANLVGDITPGSVYAHIDQSLGSWAQRPVFKTNVKTFVSLRKAKPPIALQELQALATHFPTPEFEFKLDPSFEPERSKESWDDTLLPPPDPRRRQSLGFFRTM